MPSAVLGTDEDSGTPGSVVYNKSTVSLTWQDVSYTVEDHSTKSKKTIVHPSSGAVAGGELLALMGPSGSGKTSLLDVLAMRQRGKNAVTGKIRICGEELSLGKFRQVTAYVEQEDALLGSLTVYETAWYAASLSAPCADRDVRRGAVERTLHCLGLWGVRDVIIGTPLKKGISGGQKRRVSVAIQLVTDPKVLFLDEPTSGLDSTASFEVVSSLREVARRTGAIVVASIHQPSTATFELFNRCLLLARGQTVFNGPVPDMLDFFQFAGRPCPEHTNPSEHALDITNTDFSAAEDAEQRLQALVSAWTASPFAVQLADRVMALSAETAGVERLENALPVQDSESLSGPACAANEFRRIYYLLHRNLVKAVRDPLAYAARLVMYIGLAALMALTFFTTPGGQGGIQTVLNSLFFGAAFLSFMCVAYVPSFIEDLGVYRRERNNGIGSPAAFLFANGLIGLPFLFAIALVFTLIVYWAVPYRAGGFGSFLLYLFLDLVAAESMVIAVAALVPVFVIALALTAFLNGFWMVIGGFLIPPNILNVFWTHSFWYINYQRYAFFGLVKNEFASQTFACQPLVAGGCNCMYVTSLADQCLISGAEMIAQMGFSGVQGLFIGCICAIALGMRIIAWGILHLRT